MNLPDVIADETRAAVLETDELSARRVGDFLAETFAPDEVAVSLVDTGQERLRSAAGGASPYFSGTIPMKRPCAI